MAFDSTDPVFLVIVSLPGVELNEQGEAHACAICRGLDEVGKFLERAGKIAGGWTMFPLAGGVIRFPLHCHVRSHVTAAAAETFAPCHDGGT